MTLLEENHLSAIEDNPEFKRYASKECAKITLQFAIDVLTELRNQASKIGEANFVYVFAHEILKLEKQLSDLNKNS